MRRMNWDKLLSTKRVEEFGTCEKMQSSQYNDPRSHFEKDCDQIVYSYSFRRLQDKTQVIPFPEFDFVHTRLTHTLEVASIGRSFGKLAFPLIKKECEDCIVRDNLSAGDIGALIAGACYAHDIGNPPFGHSGEDSISLYFSESLTLAPESLFAVNLNKEETEVCYTLMEGDEKREVTVSPREYAESIKRWKDFSTYEGNANGFRILTKNCDKGINPTCALLGVFTKYPLESFLYHDPFEANDRPKSHSKYGFFQTEKELFKQVAEELGLLPLGGISNVDIAYHRHPLAFLLEASDDIAYGMIDFEDGCRLGLIDFEKEYRTVKLKNKKTNKFEEITINESPLQILSMIATIDHSYDKDLKGLKDFRDIIAYLRSKVINVMTHECFKVFEENYEKIMTGNFHDSLIELIDEKIYSYWKKMKWLVKKYVYNHPPVLYSEASGFEVMRNLIESLGITSGLCYSCDEVPNSLQTKLSSLLPDEYLINEEVEGKLTEVDQYKRMMSILDYVSGMTDNYAISLYRKIKGITLHNR